MPMLRSLLASVLLPASVLLLALSAAEASPAEAFMTQLQPLCGKAFAGKLVEGNASDQRFAESALVMHVRECSPEGMRIALHVGEDRSRTWVLTRTAQGLRLKHDHRHQDGHPDKITQYGGDSQTTCDAKTLEFPADAETAAMLPASATNIWRLEIERSKRFSYALRREGRRFRIDFDISRPVTLPPPPW